MTDFGGSDELRVRDELATAMDDNFNPDRYPVMTAMFRDYADLALPIIAREVERRVAEAKAALDEAEQIARVNHGLYISAEEDLKVAEARLEALRAAYPNTIPMLEAALAVGQEGDNNE